VRRALNENPVVQLVVLGIGGIVVALLLLSRLGGDSETAEPVAAGGTPAAASPAPTEASASTTPAAAAPAADPAAGASAVPVAPTADAVGGASGGLEAGRGLPADVVSAYARGQTVVLLVISRSGMDDPPVEAATRAVSVRGDVELFAVPSKRIARYSRITQGVRVSRTPAIVVVAPRSGADAARTATVSDGFRDTESVERAIDDALYEGPTVPYHPG
jgi:hypothetical protein